MAIQVPDRLQTFTNETGQELTFGNFIRYHDYEPEVLLVKETWREWKAKAQLGPIPIDPDLARLKKTLVRAAFINGPQEVALLRKVNPLADLLTISKVCASSTLVETARALAAHHTPKKVNFRARFGLPVQKQQAETLKDH